MSDAITPQLPQLQVKISVSGGTTFTPAVDADGNLSWSNDNGLKNPDPVNIMGSAGPQGEKGQDGSPGRDGVDGRPGQDGKDGNPGKDGISATHSWNGTKLTITSASGTSSADLKGETGPAGRTPIKGTDYFTDADKAEMVNAVLAALPAAEGVDF